VPWPLSEATPAQFFSSLFFESLAHVFEILSPKHIRLQRFLASQIPATHKSWSSKRLCGLPREAARTVTSARPVLLGRRFSQGN
jgi:hypothetical protein